MSGVLLIYNNPYLDDPSIYRTNIVLKGEHEFTTNDKTYIMQEGQVWFINRPYIITQTM